MQEMVCEPQVDHCGSAINFVDRAGSIGVLVFEINWFSRRIEANVLSSGDIGASYPLIRSLS